MTVEKPKPKQLLRPITTGADSAMNHLQFLAITCNSHTWRDWFWFWFSLVEKLAQVF